jgi:hypothetical protein
VAKWNPGHKGGAENEIPAITENEKMLHVCRPWSRPRINKFFKKYYNNPLEI